MKEGIFFGGILIEIQCPDDNCCFFHKIEPANIEDVLKCEFCGEKFTVPEATKVLAKKIMAIDNS